MEKTTINPDEFLATLPDEYREDMLTLDACISTIMKGEPRVLWGGTFWGGSKQSIIGYGTMHYTRSDKKTGEWFPVGLSLQKNYISIYVSVVDAGKYLAEQAKDELGKAKVGKSSISFKRLADINLPALEKLIRRAREVQ